MKRGVVKIVFFLAISYTFISVSAHNNQFQSKLPPEREEYSANEYFVSFKEGLISKNVASLRTGGIAIRRQFANINAVAIKVSDRRELEQLAADARVEYIEPVPKRYALNLYANQLAPDFSNGLYGLLATKADIAHSRGVTGNGIKIGVADTGIDYYHPDIAPNYRGGIDIVDFDDDPYWNNEPDEAHGTHVAGTIIAANNRLGVLGVAYDAKLYHARVLGPFGGSAIDVMEGVSWLVEVAGCRLINLSLGGTRASRTEEKFYRTLHEKGVIIVCAAGNDGGNKLDYPARYATNIAVGATDTLNQLASFSNRGENLDVVAPGLHVISSVPKDQGTEAMVATDANYAAFTMEFASRTEGISRQLVYCGLGRPKDFPEAVQGQIALIKRGKYLFSEKVFNAMNAGAEAAIIFNSEDDNFEGTLGDTAAPDGRPWIPVICVSKQLGLMLKNQAALGINKNEQVTIIIRPSDWDIYSGTSMSAPHVTGVLALIWSANPALSPETVENYLLSTCTDLGAKGYDPEYGFGLVDAAAAVEKAFTGR